MTFRLFFAPVLAGFLFVAARPAQAQIQWVNSYSQARALAAQSGKPLFVKFYADWCGACRQMDEQVFSRADIQNEARGWIFYKADTDNEGARLGQQLNIRYLPSLLFCAPNGGIVKRNDGSLGAAQLLASLQSVRASYSGGATAPGQARNSAATKKSGAARMAARQNWQKMPEVQRALKEGNVSGVYLLDEGGTVALSPKPKAKPAPKKRAARRR